MAFYKICLNIKSHSFDSTTFWPPRTCEETRLRTGNESRMSNVRHYNSYTKRSNYRLKDDSQGQVSIISRAFALSYHLKVTPRVSGYSVARFGPPTKVFELPLQASSDSRGSSLGLSSRALSFSRGLGPDAASSLFLAEPHTDTLKEFPYLGTPHPKKSQMVAAHGLPAARRHRWKTGLHGMAKRSGQSAPGPDGWQRFANCKEGRVRWKPSGRRVLKSAPVIPEYFVGPQ